MSLGSLPKKVLFGTLSTGPFAPLGRSVGRKYAGVATSLMYHRVLRADSPEAKDPFNPNRILAVSDEAFDRQMRKVAAEFKPMSLGDAVKGLKYGNLPERAVTVTFDDGYLDNLEVALPILERYRVPATIYITTGLIDRACLVWWAELEHILRHASRLEFFWKGRNHSYVLTDVASKTRVFAALNDKLKSMDYQVQAALMAALREQVPVPFSYGHEVLTWEQVQALDKHPLITIAAHTVNHYALSRVPAEVVEREMRESRRILEEKLGHKIPHFAYPFGGRGQCGSREFELCAKGGFASSVTTRAGHWHPEHAQHLHALPRVMIDWWDTDRTFGWKLAGLDSAWQARGQRVVVD